MNRIGITTKIIVAAALATTTAALLPASAGADSDTQRLAAAGVDTSELAPGWEVRGDEIVWQDGAIMATVGPAGVNDCDDGYLCFWEDKNYTGRRLQFRDTGLRGNMHDYSFNDEMSSWRNRRGYDGRWYHDYNGEGKSRCTGSGARNPDVGAGVTNTDNDEMSSFRIYGNSTTC